MKILIADDSRVMRQIVIRTLRQAGYDSHEVVEADGDAARGRREKGAQEAVRVLAAHERRERCRRSGGRFGRRGGEPVRHAPLMVAERWAASRGRSRSLTPWGGAA